MQRTIHPSKISCTAALAILISSGVFAQDTPCEERVPLNCATVELFPYNTIGELTWPAAQPGFSVFGTAFLVSPHCALTNGHCVYSRNQGSFIQATQTFTPGACREGNDLFGVFGSRTVDRRVTNNKWANSLYTPRQGVDYGAVQFICPFDEITTFMPLCFGYEPDWAHMSGYPISDLPNNTESRNQLLAYGDVVEIHERWVEYDARSTGGASGSPVWDLQNNSQLADAYAINSGHIDDCGGIGPRLVWQNEDLIRTWMRWQPSLSDQIESGCPPWAILPWFGLVDFFEQHEDLQLDSKDVRAVNPIEPPPTGPSRRYMQVIERGFYEWVVYDLQPGNPDSSQLIQLLAAPDADLPGIAWFPGMEFNPQTQGWLSVEQATALLSGSAGKAAPPVTGIGAVELEFSEIMPVQQPIPDADDGGGDQEPDGEVPSDDVPCPGDLNGDRKVNGGDLGLLLAMWGQCAPGAPCPADLNGDNRVDGGDLGLMLGAFGSCG